MSARPPRTLQRMLVAPLGALGLLMRLPVAAGAEPPAAAPPSNLQTCAGIAADTERLACYDRVAGRAVQSAVAPVPNASATAASAPAGASLPDAAAPAAAAVDAAPAAAAAATATAARSTPAAAAPAASAPPSADSFGLYAAEHPKPLATANSLEAAIVALGKSTSGRTTVSLAGGAVWELDEADPLLAVGDVVTITRAALGSYVMHTPTRRTHRVRRLQ